MNKKKRHWFWNLLIILTLIVCFFAFLAHYKNWYKLENEEFKVLSGIYYQKIPLAEIDSLKWEAKLPELERSSGFSWMVAEKGVFIDSIRNTNVHFFVDDLEQQKIKLVHHDSLQLYINFKDSIETKGFYDNLQTQMESLLESSN